MIDGVGTQTANNGADDSKQATLPLSDPRELARQLGPASTRLIVLDFDGVLSPIVDRPEDAAPAPGAVEAIQKLTAQTSVAVVSGRPIADLQERLGQLPVTFAGGHGAEVAHADGSIDHLADAGEVASVLDALETELRGLVDDMPGWLVERKATSLAVHHRLAATESVDEHLPRVVALLERRQDEGPGFGVIAGKAVHEIRPIGVDKGRALIRIVERLGAGNPLVVGDDVTDEDAFASANQLGGDAILVAEEPRPTAASFRIFDPVAVVDFLDELTQA